MNGMNLLQEITNMKKNIKIKENNTLINKYRI